MSDEKEIAPSNAAPPGYDTKDAVSYEKATEVEDNNPHDESKDEPETARVLDHKAERALCFKLDIRLMPVLAIMCALWDIVAAFCSHSRLNEVR